MISEINKNLKKTKIFEEEKIIRIELLNEGWISELFIIVQLLKKDKNLKIKNIFQVYEEENMIIKESLEIQEKILDLNYTKFVDLIKNETKKKEIGSGRVNWNKIKEIEIRLKNKINEKNFNGLDIKKITELGFNEARFDILKEFILIETS
jgi:PDZ domain-containing secreted protein